MTKKARNQMHQNGTADQPNFFRCLWPSPRRHGGRRHWTLPPTCVHCTGSMRILHH
ncbi:uncharacterized protein B0I36DRAFT_329188 [Microdochium trichocladiopsis]|uniref:Uncharacterized protein n=1 Tax=Microdochium trichocladiopsis TaxID=1682393 RepID=A0A9P9BMG0_9PEZI|nr:uncharacterized protein B0I36DRAFT_329188 [Microdochium trichocladiopsis]KAH7025811.1 hypothetical protein B0I36DRAFT_329188 [Microdochium trichocladiopsis]